MSSIEACIIKTLEVSTCHIPESTDVMLTAKDTNGLDHLDFYYAAIEHGWRIAVPASAAAMGTLRLMGHTELAALMQRAVDVGCHYLVLDGDADVLDGHAIFEW